MPFNPDEFLAAKQEKTAPIAFDPDAFLGAAPALTTISEFFLKNA